MAGEMKGGRWKSRKVHWAMKGPRSVKRETYKFSGRQGENDNYGVALAYAASRGLDRRGAQHGSMSTSGTRLWYMYALGGCKCDASEPRRARRGDTTQRRSGERRIARMRRREVSLSGKGWWFRAREVERRRNGRGLWAAMARRVTRLKIMILHLTLWRILVSCDTFKALDLRLRDVCRMLLLHDTIYQPYNVLAKTKHFLR